MLASHALVYSKKDYTRKGTTFIGNISSTCIKSISGKSKYNSLVEMLVQLDKTMSTKFSVFTDSTAVIKEGVKVVLTEDYRTHDTIYCTYNTIK